MRFSTPVAVTVTMLTFLALSASCSKEEPEPELDAEALKRAEAVQTFAIPSHDSAGQWAGLAATSEALPRMIDLGRGKCIPCKKMEPILRELRQAYAGKAVIEIINLDDHRDAADRYDLRVIPTQIFFDAAGSEVWRHEGFLSRDAIVARLEEMGVEPAGD